MSADQATDFFLYRDCLMGVSDHWLVPKDGGLQSAPQLRLREGTVNNGGPDGRTILGSIIHESPAYLKFYRAGIVGSGLTKESGVLGAGALFLYAVRA
jgi:hypothetical protein